MNKGWQKEPARHSLAARGVKTGRYYHSTGWGNKKIANPEGYYEAVEPGSCPTELFDGVGFKTSRIKEVCFSKSIEGAVLANARGHEARTLHIYATTEPPEIDISYCGYDFDQLEEVRYRHDVPVEEVLTVTISKGLAEYVDSAYTENGIMEHRLTVAKEHIKRQLHEGKRNLTAPDPVWAERTEAHNAGLTVAELREHERNWKEHAGGWR